MFPINQFVIKKVKESGNVGTFHIGPLPKGYGHTLANMYRRVLLSSIEGSAITSVKINGVQHEYTTMAGLQDDVLSVVLALKGIAVISHSDEPVRLKLSGKGKKGSTVEITAADIEKNPMVEIVDPSYVITKLTSDTSLEAEIVVSKGFGYSYPDEGVRSEVGSIPLDANFNPIRLVGIKVTDTRVGQQTDLDLVELEVVTNGAITPSAGLHKAAEIMTKLSEHLLSSANDMLSQKASDEVERSNIPVADDVEEEEVVQDPINVNDLGLSTRLTNALVNSGYEDLRQLSGLTEEEVAGIKGMGEKSFLELKDILSENDIELI